MSASSVVGGEAWWRSPRWIVLGRIALAVVLGVAAALLGNRQINDDFKRIYVAADLAHPESFLADASLVGASEFGLLEWRAGGALVVPGVVVRSGDRLKAQVLAECGQGVLAIRAGGGEAVAVPLGPGWQSVDVTMSSAGRGLRLDKRVPEPCPVHLSRLSVANFHGEMTGVIEAHLVRSRSSRPALGWLKLLLLAITPAVVMAVAGAWQRRIIQAPPRRAWRVAAGCALVPLALLLAFEVVGAIRHLWPVMPGRSFAVLFALPVAILVAVSAVKWAWRGARRLPWIATGAGARMVQGWRDVSAGDDSEANGGDARPWQIPWRTVSVAVAVALVATVIFAMAVVQDFGGVMLGHGDLNQWLHQADYFARNLSFTPLPHLDLVNDQLYFPYGGNNVFQPWAFEMQAFCAALTGVFGLGPWLQIYFVLSIFVTAVGSFLILLREVRLSRAVVIAFALAFANYYSINKFPGHANLACIHWMVLGILLDGILVRRHCDGRGWSARLVALRALVLVAGLGLDLGYAAGIALTSLVVSVGFVVVRSVVLDRGRPTLMLGRVQAVIGEVRRSFSPHRGAVISLLVGATLVGACTIPLVLDVRSASARVDSRGMPLGGEWANPARMLIPVLPGWNPVRNQGAFKDRFEAVFAASPGWFFLAIALIGLAVGGRRRWAALPALAVLVLFLTFDGEVRPWLRVLPWFSFARVSGRFTVAYPVLLAVIGLAAPDRMLRRRGGRIVAYLAVALLVTEMATAYSVRLTRTEQFWRPDSGFLAMMKVIRETPGQAVFDWPFCVAGGNGIGTGKIGRFYRLQSGISVLQVYHGKKIVGNYFGRLHPELIRPYLDAGWDSLFVPDSRDFRIARVQRRDFYPGEWDFVEAFFKLNDFAGIVLYADLLPAETLTTFHSRFGPPAAVARGEPYGRIEFIAKKPEWRALVDPVAGRNLRLTRRGAPWEPGRRVAFTDLVVQDFLGAGWGGANTEGKVAEIRFALDRIEALNWSLRARPLGPQRVVVELNGHSLETVRLGGGEETLTQRLPVDLLERDNTIVLRLPDACSPKSLGINNDPRILSLTASWMALQRHAMPAPPLDESLAMDGEDVEAFLGSGWGQGERRFGLRSTRGTAAKIHFGLDPIEPLVVTIEAQTVGRQRVEFELNGQSILAREGDGAWGRIEVALPQVLLRSDNELLIRLPDARSPRSVGAGPDDRVLGLAVRTVEFHRATSGFAGSSKPPAPRREKSGVSSEQRLSP